MASADRRKRSPPFVMVYQSWMKERAWRALSGNEIAVFLQVLRRYTGTNNGEIMLSERQVAAECGISKTTARKCLLRLDEIGWIRPNKKSGFNARGIPTTWRVTVWPAFGKAASHNYRNWTGEQKS